MILYRPVGTKELELIEKSNYRAFPPRLPEQPIFYLVLNEQYATEKQTGNIVVNQNTQNTIAKTHTHISSKL